MFLLIAVFILVIINYLLHDANNIYMLSEDSKRRFVLSSLPPIDSSSPSNSPSGELNEWYPDFSILDWANGVCINTAPVPNGLAVYSSQLQCCLAYYNGQESGACIADLPNPPTSSPTNQPTTTPTLSPSANPTMSPTSSPTTSPSVSPSFGPSASPSKSPTLSPTKSPSTHPTISPSSSPSISPNQWYPDFSLDFEEGKCINTAPVPDGVPSYASQLQCCQGSYSSQQSGACIADLPNPPTVSPTSSPTTSPSSSPSEPQLTLNPSLSPSKSLARLTLSLSTSPSHLQFSKSPSASPSLSPSASPIQTPTLNPTAGLTLSPPSSPSHSQPSPSPNTSLSLSPTVSPMISPTLSPLAKLSTSPTASPSSVPATAQPTTKSPLSSPITASNEYFPNWGRTPHICLLDDGSQTLPDGAPLYVSLQECCDNNYGWNHDQCIGITNSPSGKYFPDRDGTSYICLLDDGSNPVPSGVQKYDSLSSCCSNHYSWNLNECNGVAAGPSNKYFPNWGNSPHECLLDDGSHVLPDGAPLYNALAECCDNNYRWNLNNCNGINSEPTNKFFPNWEGSPDVCLLDDGSNVMPDAAPLYHNRLVCCFSNYWWKLIECMGSP